MKIQDALKETGKAIDGITVDWYVAKNLNGVLCWFRKDNDEFYMIVSMNEVVKASWLPYHKEKEIRPEKAGELWRHEATTHSWTGRNKNDS